MEDIREEIARIEEEMEVTKSIELFDSLEHKLTRLKDQLNQF